MGTTLTARFTGRFKGRKGGGWEGFHCFPAAALTSVCTRSLINACFSSIIARIMRLYKKPPAFPPPLRLFPHPNFARAAVTRRKPYYDTLPNVWVTRQRKKKKKGTPLSRPLPCEATKFDSMSAGRREGAWWLIFWLNRLMRLRGGAEWGWEWSRSPLFCLVGRLPRNDCLEWIGQLNRK